MDTLFANFPNAYNSFDSLALNELFPFHLAYRRPPKVPLEIENNPQESSI